ncbi:GP88 family protein [Zavarzinella formosa]
MVTQSNDKLGGSVFHFDLPAGRHGTCPGRTSTCDSQCYAQRGRFLFPQVQDRLAYCYAATKRKDFVPRLVSELYRKGVLAMRWMVSGDVYSPGFAKKVMAVAEGTPFCRHWLYSRSWRIPAIEAVLRDLALVDNVSVWYSADRDAFPTEVPPRVRVAYMMSDADDHPVQPVDLVFLVHRLRKMALPMANVCLQETPEGRESGVTCSTCQVCLPD